MAVEKSIDQQMLEEQVSELTGEDKEVMPADEAPMESEEAVVVEMEDGSVEIELEPTSEKDVTTAKFGENIAEYLDEEVLQEIASELIASYEEDKASREEWVTTYTEGLELLGIKSEERTTPFSGACGVTHPILSEATIRFVSQSMMEIFPASGPVKTKTVGKISDEIQAQSKRVENYMNYLLTHEMAEYRSETEQLLFHLSLAGSAFRKVYYDPHLRRPSSVFVPAEDLVVAYNTTDLVTSSRHTHVMQKSDNFVRKLQVNGFYRDIDLTEATEGVSDVKTKYNELTGVTEVSESDLRTILEVHCELEIEGYEDQDENGEATGIALPYIVTIDEASNEVLSIRNNYAEEDALKQPLQHFVHYKFQPGLGFYGFGLIHLIGNIAKSSTSILRQLIDAGTLSNLPAGFKARGLRIKGDDTPIAPGEFRDIDLPSGAIRDNLMPLPFKEPSGTLAQLLGVLVEEGRRFASIADLQVGDGNQEAPVGTTLALIERSMKVMSAIHARLHASIKREIGLLSDIICHCIEEYPYEEDGNPKEDFNERVDIIPVSDPNATSFAQRMMQQQAAMQVAAQAPQLYDLKELHRRFLTTAGLEDIEKVLPDQDEIPPYDPVTENARVIGGGPIKSFAYQDHDAHLSAHMSLMQSPEMAKHPMAQQVQAAMSAHISEHMAHKYRNEAEKMMGVQLPPLEDKEKKGLPEQVEAQVSRKAAEAAAQMTGKAQQQAVLERQMQAAQDPVIQQQQAELQVKQAKVQQEAEEAKLEAKTDIEKTKMRNALERERLAQQKDLAEAKMQVDLIKADKANKNVI
tara:strand:+ start:3432 stop:5843 length:2412 start_codon:yes stop_codon:yes gene_type:complete